MFKWGKNKPEPKKDEVYTNKITLQFNGEPIEITIQSKNPQANDYLKRRIESLFTLPNADEILEAFGNTFKEFEKVFDAFNKGNKK